ncbi:MMPL family transporter [Actinospongicola halichondriae]|uniref:MMPL family transporter n=1 Tax=Actinospongicola halichondriae TaxID=3236844 RepID=UPI003D3C88BE
MPVLETLASDPMEDATTSSRSSADGLLARLGRAAGRHRRRTIIAWALVVLVAAPLAATLTRSLSGAGWEAQGSTALEVRDELRSDFPQLGAEAAVVAYRQDVPIADDPSGIQTLIDALATSPGARSVVDPLSQPAEAGLVSPDGLAALIPVGLESDDDADLPDAAGEVMATVADTPLPAGAEADTTGEWAVWHDFNESNEEALHKAELLSGLPTILLLFVAFGSAIAAGIPLVLALAGIAVGFAVLHLATLFTPLSVWSMNFSMMIGLAVGIDYSLFIVSRYREEREDGHDALDAVAGTLATAGKAVFLSALTVVLSLSAIFLVPVMVFRSMALGMILSVVATAAASLTLLPAILVAMGDRVLVTRGQEDPDRAAEGRWARWTAAAMRRPVVTLVAGVTLLLVLAAPALGMRLGMPAAGVVERGEQSRDGYDAVVESFGPGAPAPLFVTVAADDAGRVVEIAAADPGVLAAGVVTEPAESGRTVVRVSPSTAVDDEATSSLVHRLRADLAEELPDARLGGPGSQNTDLTSALTGTAPVAIALIMAVAFGLLLVVFRSTLIAVSSIIFNLIGVAASFGFATLVFQHGYGASLLGIEHQGFVDAWAPLFFFALLFGLSMDYQLFLLAAIKERRDATGDARLAVREGIARTGRPITNAALIMIVVFIAFGVTGPIPPTELGVTLALAVFLDATVIRMMLVPSLLGLLGERAWHLPEWLDRRLPTVTFDH